LQHRLIVVITQARSNLRFAGSVPNEKIRSDVMALSGGHFDRRINSNPKRLRTQVERTTHAALASVLESAASP